MSDRNIQRPISSPSSRPSYKPISWAAFIAVLLIAIGTIGATWYFYGRGWAEKVATQMVMPMGLLSLLLLYAVLSGFFRGLWRLFFASSLLFGILYTAGNPMVSSYLMSYLETQYPPPSIESEPPLDVLIVLGGGVTSDRFGRSQLSTAGDRAMLAARLFKSGQAKLLVTTGDSMPGPHAQQLDPSENTKAIWLELGIPQESIIELPGQNTFQEIEAIKAATDLWQNRRVGVISSAFHLPRVMRLANRAGVPLIPLPADVRTRPREFNPTMLIPSAESLAGTEIAIKEWLGMLLKR